LAITTKAGEKQTIEADSIVPTSPLIPDMGLFHRLEGKVSEVYAVGDCVEPNMIVDAIAAGWRTAREI